MALSMVPCQRLPEEMESLWALKIAKIWQSLALAQTNELTQTSPFPGPDLCLLCFNESQVSVLHC